jgi:hypothetical protein
MVFFKLGMSSSLGKKEEGIYTPSPKNLIVGCQESPAKAEVKSGYSRPHRLKLASIPAIAGLKNPPLAGNSRTNSQFATEGFSPQNLGSPAIAGLLSKNTI